MGRVGRFWLTYGLSALLTAGLLAGIEGFFDARAERRSEQLSKDVEELDAVVQVLRARLRVVETAQSDVPLNPGGQDLWIEEEDSP